MINPDRDESLVQVQVGPQTRPSSTVGVSPVWEDAPKRRIVNKPAQLSQPDSTNRVFGGPQVLQGFVEVER